MNQRIQFQTMIREFKNEIQSNSDPYHPFEDNSIDLSVDEILKTTSIDTTSINTTSIDSPQRNTTTMKLSQTVPPDFRDGLDYIENIFKCEQINCDWLIAFYLNIKSYKFFIRFGELKLKSLHLRPLCLPSLCSAHHLLYNSTFDVEFTNVEWNWISNETNELQNMSEVYIPFRGGNFLNLLDYKMYTINNVNAIINQTSSTFKSINLLELEINMDGDVLEQCVFASIIMLKLLDYDCVSYIYFSGMIDPDEVADCLYLFSLIFVNSYLYHFDRLKSVLVCRNKKKLETEKLCKKLLRCIDQQNLTGLFQEKKITKVVEILKSQQDKCVQFKDLTDLAMRVLKYNHHTFL